MSFVIAGLVLLLALLLGTVFDAHKPGEDDPAGPYPLRGIVGSNATVLAKVAVRSSVAIEGRQLCLLL